MRARFVNELNEGQIVDKDWMRMSDLILSGKDGGQVANSIKDKTKAIARFISGLKLENEPLNYDERWKEFRGSFSEFGNKALVLGATFEEIQKAYDENEVPIKYLEKLTTLSNKKLNNRFVGTLSKAILNAGFDINFLPSNGNALTMTGKEAMARNGRKWTIGFKTEIIAGNNKINLFFDAITDEGDGPTSYVIDSRNSDSLFKNLPSWEPVGITKFVSGVMDSLKQI